MLHHRLPTRTQRLLNPQHHRAKPRLHGFDPSNVRINNEPSYIRPQSNAADTETLVWLDTAESNTTHLGQTVRMCHNFVPLQVGRNLTRSKEMLEKSAQYLNAASGERSEYSVFRETNNTVPWECEGSGMVKPVSRPNNSTALLEDPLTCGVRNFSREFGTFASVQNYDFGTNFPLMDIMTFFPTIEQGRTFREDMPRVQIACLVPGQVTEGGREKASVQSVLERYNSMGGNRTGGAQAIDGLSTWRLFAWVVCMSLVFAV
ncbi:hypothetical protein BU25DRAFT_446510 [Macroventuria anomochaeta]|uniref:Uncharacterized protein n=1 Tax=Macroventuria anomochaeta TaxID=301207 RepID=A0ACB6S7Q6_9PLEO|nr:uncharacterized protein BU25DRAFT_446510 [Macroventuria anomochaeta]KAF2630241.1 hypothetical protein BU25DRAFT_446510 [Macroventuria anomochaeta]